MPTPAEELLLRHPVDRALVLPRPRVPLGRELEEAGYVKVIPSPARAGSVEITLTAAGRRRREELQLDSIGRAAPPSRRPGKKAAPSPAPSPAPRPVSPRPVAATKRTPSLDDLFGQGAFRPGPAASDDPGRPATVGDLRALEERVLGEIRRLLGK